MAFVIPTIYTAVDKFSFIANKISASSAGLARSMELSSVRAQRAWDKFMPETDEALKRRFQFMVSMGKAMAVAGTALFTGKAIMDYEKELANLKSLTGATSEEFNSYKKIIEEVAVSTKVGAVDIAQGFTAIGNAMPELLGSAEALAEVTKASVLLGKAANMEMLPASEALTSILNQFGKGAEFAAKGVDMLAAGSQAGSAEIRDLQETMLNFGKAAVISGISFKEAITLSELVSKTRKGAEAGVQMRNLFAEMNKGVFNDEKSINAMRRVGINIRMIGDATVPVKDRLMEMTKLLKDTNGMEQVFKKENLVVAVSMLDNVKNFDAMNQRVSEQGVAMRMAAENTKTLYAVLERFKAAWENIAVASNGANFALSLVKGTIGFVTEHMSALLNIITPIALGLIAMRGYVMGLAIAAKFLSVAQSATNFILGVATVINGEYATSCFATTAGMNGMIAASFVLEGHLKALVLSSAGIISALGLIAMAFGEGYDNARNYNKEVEDLRANFYQLKNITNDAKIGLNDYNEALREFEGIQNFKTFQNRNQGRGFSGLLSNIKSNLQHPILAIQSLAPSASYIPDVNDYMTSEQAAEFYRQDKALRGTTNTQVIHHKVDIMQNGNIIGSFDTSAAMPSIGSTTN